MTASRLHTQIARLTNAAALIVLSMLLAGCGAAKLSDPQLAPMQIQSETVQQNYFARDKTGSIDEAGLRHLLSAPVFLEEDTRIGIVPVTVAYDVDPDLPLAVVPQQLGDALEGTGFFEVATEMSADWPADMSIAGLRELAGRYRTRYLLLYRHRFADQDRTNGWGWAYLTLVAIPFVPSKTYETAGVLEATLFDAQTGTVLFTAFERVRGSEDFNLWHNDNKLAELKGKLLEDATERLSAQVVGKVHRLVAARPEPEAPERQHAAAPTRHTAQALDAPAAP